MLIIADDKIPFLRGVLERFASVIYMPGRSISTVDVKNADALLIRTRTKCNAGLLSGSAVKFIGTATIGFDHIDTEWCDSEGIAWTNAPGCNSSSVQQYLASVLLKVAEHGNFSLGGKTLGIIGVGNVGSKVEKLARILDMNVLLNDPPRARIEGGSRFTDLGSLLSESDIITLHVPLNKTGEDRTFHLFDESTLNRVRKGAWLINSSRGEVVDSTALKSALESGRIKGAVLDVWEHEPDIDTDLMQKTFISTPHIAGYSTDGKANGTAMVVNALAQFFGLQLSDWYPEDVPPPQERNLVIDCSDKSDEEIYRAAVMHTYDVSPDSNKLRSSPGDFEKLRGNYPLRREFDSFSIEIRNGSVRIYDKLVSLGFDIK